jgi:threonine dehydrogenase-like Zn-dependent dehydrogenase
VTLAVGTARASVIAAPGRVESVTRPAPLPPPGEVVIRLEGCGVCASSLPLWEGRPWFSYPLEAGAPGHEAWGRVERVGDGVTTLAPGQRVATLSLHGFAELDVVASQACVPLPRELDGLPFPGEAFGCAYNVAERARVMPGQRVAVVGMGFLGSAIAALCRHLGATPVPVTRGSNVEESFERVIEAAGTQESLDVASRLVAESGLLVIAGYHQDGPRSVDIQSWNWRGIEIVNAHERSQARQAAGIAHAARLAAAGVLDVEHLCSHVYPADRLGDAFMAARLRPPGFVKAVVMAA